MNLQLGDVLRTRAEGPQAWIVGVVRIAAGAMFVFAFGIAKFTDHAQEVIDFRRFGVPAPGASVVVAGLIEVLAGLALLVGLLTRLSAAALAANLVGALLTAGRNVGGSFHLGVGPALLVLMLGFVWLGGGRPSVDERLLARVTGARHG